jgi:hypothetical protein
MHFLSVLLVLFAMQIPSDDPIDVPAIKEHRALQVVNPKDLNREHIYYTDEIHWTCKDPHRALIVSVDGSLHWCHKAQF